MIRPWLGLFLLAGASFAQADERERFEMEVRPLLANNCWTCHRQTAMGGLRLDSLDTILKGGKSGPAIVPGKPGESLLIQAVSHKHERLKMPPQGQLTEAQIAALADWVKRGAYWPPAEKTAAPKSSEYVITPEQRAFWAYQPVRKPASPSSIDGFVRERLQKEGLHPVARADKRTLIRRATFDLTGLPPTPGEVDAFLKDKSPDAFPKVVDRLLASPRYGERWARYWLDVARYSDDVFNSTTDDPYPNSFRYRNWVIRAFNEDMPYNLFVKAQIAGDQIACGDPLKYRPGLGFYALSPEMQDDRVDATTKGFLGLTVACAACHDHKFDPIPTKDFYSLEGVFASTKLDEFPLVSKDVVEAWQKQKQRVDKQNEVVTRFYAAQRDQLGQILASQTARFMLATRKLAPAEGLDAETLERWNKYLADRRKDHPFLKNWFDLAARKAPVDDFRKAATEFQELVIAVTDEKRRIDEKNKITLGLDPDRGKIAGATLESLERDRYVLWRDLFERSTKDAAGFFQKPDGVYYYSKGNIERFLQGAWKDYLEAQKAELARLEKELPEKYPFLQVVSDAEKPADIHVAVRGDRNNPGELAPRRFLAILSSGERKPFTQGSGRMELAEAIADPRNPLTARVMVNRIWQHHFGRGIVATASNFGQMGERPTHPELLDYLAARFMEYGWSVKSIHREIMLSDTYALGATSDAADAAKDPENRLLWRANRRRLDIESLRDSILCVSGSLDASPAEKAAKFDEKNTRRTVYGFVSRRKLDGTLALFDFPNPNNTAEDRNVTNVPLQRLFFMNSAFVDRQAQALAERFTGDGASRIRQMYRTLFGRDPDAAELRLGLDFLKRDAWRNYAQALLSSNEFLFVD
jgi:hypothetical protein